ncbi:MAG TPA: LamG-like jellyroll fold domain-containing protein [Burkholderiales bacterium]|nr:LamG-like jellyroll fold domain-containing protein [Burkholderiales bacterium]
MAGGGAVFAALVALASAPSPVFAQATGLVAAYALNEGSGTTVADSSGNNNNGTLSAATWTTAGKFGNALTFNGTSARVTVPNSTSLRLTNGMTLEAWVFPTGSLTSWRSVVDKTVDGYYLMGSSDPNNRPAVGGTWTSGNQNLIAPTALTLNAWTHLAATFDGATVKLYVNGTQVASQAQTTPLTATTGTLQIGADSYGEFFAGRIDEVRIYNRALSVTEIQTDMNTPLGGAADTTAPTAPGALSATAAGATQVNLAWTASTDNVAVTNYLIESCVGAGCTTFAQIATSATPSFSNTGLTSGTSYSYRVRATDAAGNLSTYSNTASVVTSSPDTTPPTAPSGLTATPATATQINLAWAVSTDDVAVTNYLIERCQGASCTTFAQVATSTTPSFGNVGLTGSTSYSYRVRATDASGNLSAYSNVASATTPAAPDTTPPSAPSVVSAAVPSGTQVDLSWTASTDNVGVTGYQVDRCQGASCTTFAQIATPTATGFSDTGLTPATAYRYRVRAVDAAGNVSANSTTVNATTLDSVAPTAPASLTANASSSTQINLAWIAATDNVGVSSYLVERCLSASCSFAQITTTTATSFNDSGLTAGTGYSYRVRASDAANNLGPYSNTATATTQAPDTTAPTAPGGPTATVASNSQINLSWTAATDNVGVTGYMVERCQGAGCSTFAQIAAPTGTTFNDTGLTAATSYSYRVRATDAANNLGPYSTVTSATTSAAPTGLVAAYAFQEGSGTTVADSSGKNNNGTLSAATWTTAGQFGNALVFNGTSARVTVPNSTSLQLTNGMTLEAWVFPTGSLTSWRSVVDKTVDGYYLMGSSDPNNRPAVGGTWTSGNQNLIAPTALTLNAWTHLAATFDGATVKLYVNGTQVASQAQTTPLTATTGTLQIGADSFGEFFAGRIDEVRIYSRALTQAEIQTDMTTSIAPLGPDTTAPSAPSGLGASAIGATQVNLAWTASTDNVAVTNYLIESCQGAGCTTFAQIATSTTPSFSNTGLTAGGSYSYRVRATDAAGNLSAYSNTATAVTPIPDITPPTAPAGLTATPANATQINLAWTASTDNIGVTNYLIERCQGASCTTFAQVATSTTPSLGNVGLTGSTSYSYRVRATDASGNLSAYSNVASATTPAAPDTTPPSAPSVISATVVSASEIDLSWTASTDNVGVTGYQVDRCTGVSCTNFVQVATSTTPSYNDLGLAGSTTYRYRARAVDAAGNVSANSSIVNATTLAVPDTTPPSVPTGLTATSTSPTQVVLAWIASTDNVGVTGYIVERCTGTPCPWVQIGTTTATSFTDTGLTPATTYSYWVRATDAAGNLSGWSTIVPVTTQSADTTAPSAPGGLTATAASNTAINLAWTAATDNVGVTGYRVERCQGAGCSTFTQIATPTGTSFGDSGLAAGNPYSYRVRATDAAGNLGPYSSVASATTSNTVAGLIAAYDFNEGTGTTVADASGHNNNGTLTATTWTSAGRYGNAAVFNGTSSIVTVPNSATLQLTTAMTMEAWVFPTQVPSGWRAVIDKNTDGYYLMASSDLAPGPAFGGTWTDGNHNTPSPTVLVLNDWTHLAATFDGATAKLYANGVLLASQAQTVPLAPTTGTLTIGGDAFGEFFAGRIDEVRIYNRALTQAEIQLDTLTPIGGSPTADTTPPNVNMTSPAPGAVVSNVISIAANAADNVGVAAVQFLLDGAPLGSPVSSPPYSIVWDTTTTAPGSHNVQARATDFANNSTTSSAVTVTVAAATPATIGQWSAPTTWPIVSVHANLLPTGEILAWDGQSDGNDARVWNPITNVFTAVPNSLTNMFCAGHCQLADGRQLVVGGHIAGHDGLRDTNIFNPTTRTWTKVAPMAVGRWYPTATVLPDGRILATSGEINCAGCFAPIPEIYNVQTNTWTQITTASQSFPYYPHLFVLPDGRVLAASTAEDAIVSRVLNLATGTWSVVDPNPVDGGSAAMYVPGKIMKTGRSFDPDQPVVPSAANTYVIDMTQPSPAWRETPPMMFPRTYHTTTLLPDGTVLVTGGGTTTDAVGLGDAVLTAELWSPLTETWSALSKMQKPRLYHSEALLLPDGRVAVMGGGRFNGVDEPTDQLSSEFFSPPYLFKGARPTISSAPASTTYGANIAVQTPDAAAIASVSMIKLGSVTHAFNTDQRFLPLQFAAAGTTLNVQAPANSNLAVPGFYMLFILNANGVPSVAAIIQIQ